MHSTASQPTHQPRPGQTPTISAVFPAYKEVAIIEQSVLDMAAVLEALVHEYEIIVVDDGSRDETREVLMELAEHRPGLPLRVVLHEQNQGYGAALASGFDAATKELIFITDGDRQFDVAELSRFLPALDAPTDLVIGYREKRADPPIRLLNARGWKLLVNGLF